MACEFVENAVQLVQPDQNVLLDTSIACTRGNVGHHPGAGIVTLNGNCGGCNRFARYQVTFNGNIAIPDGGTVGPIAVALALQGEPIQTSRAIVTPAATEEYFNVTSTAIITVPKGCCYTVAVENVSEPATVGGAAPAINVQNANLTVSRIA